MYQSEKKQMLQNSGEVELSNSDELDDRPSYDGLVYQSHPESSIKMMEMSQNRMSSVTGGPLL